MSLAEEANWESDDQGFPIIPEFIETGAEDLRSKRLLQADQHDRMVKAVFDGKLGKDKTAAELLRLFSDHQDTIDFLTSRLAAKFIKDHEEEGAFFDMGVRFGEQAKFSVFWTRFPEGTDGLQPILYMFGDTEDGMDWSQQVIFQDKVSEDFTLTAEDRALIEQCADRKTYSDS